ncbi:MAG: tape measure protein [Bacteroidales bacterium]|nr:tape measure protein [Bacteroidales bacterium]
MDSYSVQAVLSVKDNGFTSGMRNASNVVNGVDSSTQKSSKSVGALGTAFAIANKVVSGACNVIKNSVSDAVSRVDTLNQFPQVMEQMGFSSAEAEKSINKLSDGIDGLPTSLDSIVSSTQSIALITGDLDEATDVALALNDAFLASGASTDEAERGVEAYQKMLSTGKVNQQNWITMQQNMSWALSEVSEDLGYAKDNTWELYYALQDGEVTFDDFNAALVRCDTATGGFSETARVSTQGIATSWQNVQTAVVKGVANMITAWNEAAADNGLPTIQESLNSLKGVVNKVFGAASQAITIFVNNLDMIVDAVVPVVAGIVSMKVIEQVTSSFGKFKDKCQQVADSLQNYEKNAEKAEKAAENNKIASEALEKAYEKHDDAVQKSIDATVKLKEAQDNQTKAQESLDKAKEKSADTTEKGTKATKEEEEAEAALAEAKKATEQAEQEKADAEKERIATSEEVAAAESLVSDTTNESATAMQGYTIMAVAQNAIMGALSGTMSLGTGIVKAFNAAWDANPVGLVISAITTAISVIKTVINVLKKFGVIEDSDYEKAKDFKDGVDELTESIQSNRDTMEENTKSAESHSATIDSLCTNIEDLASKENKSAEDTALLQSYITDLNDNVDDLGLAYDETTDSLNMATEAMEAQAKVETKTNEKEVAQDNYNTALEDYLSLGSELEAAQEMEDEMADSSVFGKRKQQKAIQELEEEYETQEKVVENAESEKVRIEQEAAEAEAAAYELQKKALEEAVEDQTVMLEDLSEENQDTAEALQETWQDYTDIATDMFEVLDTEVEISVDDMIQNMQENQKIMSEWGDNCENLRNRFADLGLDQAVLDQLVDLGPEGAGYIAELVNASDEQLAELSDTYQAGGQTAYTSMGQGMGEGAKEVMDQAEGIITDAEKTMREKLENTDWTDIGESIPEGTAEGIEEESGQVTDASLDMEDDSHDAVAEEIGMGSPARKYIPVGESMDEGIAQGLRQDESVVENAAKRIIRDIEQTFNSLGSSTSSGISKMSAAFTSGMATMQSTSSSGMSKIKSVMSSGMTSIASTVTSGMTSMKSTMSSGFASMASTVTSQMSKIKNAFSSGMASIKSVVTSGMDNVKSAITAAMNSITTSVSGGISKMNSAMSSGMNQVRNTAQSAANSITQSFNGLYNSLYSSGQSAMAGLQNGLESRRGSVQATANSIALSISSTINSALQVGSPSRVLDKTGQNAGQGLVNGLKKMLGDIEDMAAEMADAVNSMVFGAFDSPKLAFAGGMDIGMSYTLDGEDILDALEDLKDSLADNSYEFTIPLDVDGRQIAKATATYTQDELNKMESRDSRRQKFSIGG